MKHFQLAWFRSGSSSRRTRTSRWSRPSRLRWASSPSSRPERSDSHSSLLKEIANKASNVFRDFRMNWSFFWLAFLQNYLWSRNLYFLLIDLALHLTYPSVRSFINPLSAPRLPIVCSFIPESIHFQRNGLAHVYAKEICKWISSSWSFPNFESLTFSFFSDFEEWRPKNL